MGAGAKRETSCAPPGDTFLKKLGTAGVLWKRLVVVAAGQGITCTRHSKNQGRGIR